MNRFHLDLVDWRKVETLAKMVEDRTMEKAELRFGPLVVTMESVYTPEGTALSIAFTEAP